MRRKHDPAKPGRELPPEPAVKFFTVAELAQRWRVSRHTITAAIHGGRLHAFKPDRHAWRISEGEVLRYEQAQPTAVAS